MSGEGLHRGWRTKGNLPHFDFPELYQFVTFRLADSLPKGSILSIHRAAKVGGEAFTEELDVHLDSGHGACWLRNPEVAGVVNAALLFFDGQRYDLHHWCVMPNHVHAMFRVYPGYPLDKEIHSWKSFSANSANRILERSGDFFQHGYFDRVVRDEEHFFQTAKYIEENPVKAGLCALPDEWEWSSAFARNLQRG
jgi:REP element-mobilizing transposase RayT